MATGTTPENQEVREPSLVDALIPMAALAVTIGGALLVFGLDALDGPVQVALVLCVFVAALVAMRLGHTWAEVEEAAKGSLASVTSAIFILLSVGALIGVWNLTGTIPTLVYYGIELLSPSVYYAAAAVVCGVVAMSIGSSWTTAGTVGVGLVGIAHALGVSPEITAGAVISGAYLGDKLSPLSETTVLASQLVGVDTHRHIRQQAWTSVPAFGIALLGFLVIGLVRGDDATSPVPTDIELRAIGDVFHVTPLNLVPLALLVWLSIRKVPAPLALLAATLFAGALGAVLQPDVVRDFVDPGHTGDGPLAALGRSVEAVWQAMATGFRMDSGVPVVDRLVSRGGMASMLSTVWLIIGAVTFGAILERFGLIARLVDPLIAAATTTGRLFATVLACAFGLNLVAGDQYIALVLPTKVFRVEFGRRGLAPTNLSRLAADCGTVTSPLVPWNSCGAFMAAVLSVPTLKYLPFAFFCLASPVLSVLYGITGFRIERETVPEPTGAAA
ncbi:MAG TPA: Na+/H+ antiporter NhaC family protein [Acidimicrobiales bacterium]